jgi:molecular chaperone HtpG
MSESQPDPTVELFQVDLRGVMDVLARHLYSTTDVFLRELLQNAVDAIAARRQLSGEFDGKVTFEADEKAGVITVVDNGVGLTEAEIRAALARVGGSTKRLAEDRRQSMIGQFGIGMLSCFMVADEIHLVTRSANGDAQPISWVGRADGTYTVAASRANVDAGTQVSIKLREDSLKYADSSVLVQLLTKFARMLPVDVGIKHDDYRQRVSLETQPWDRDLTDPGEAIDCKHDLEIWSEDAAEVFFLDGGEDFRGVGVVQLGMSQESAKHRHAVYVKDMFVTDSPDDLVPEWATFVRCFLTSHTLRPTASREALYDDDTYRRAQDRVADELMAYMHGLAERKPALLKALIAEHDLSFRRIALSDDRFFDSVVSLLPFETSDGETTLGAYTKESSTLRVTSSSEQFRLAAPIARIGGQPVFNGGYTFHYELLARAAERSPGLEWVPISVDDLVQSLRSAPPHEAQRLNPLRDVLARSGFPPLLKLVEFEPADVAALYVEGEDSAVARALESAHGVSNGAWREAIETIRGSLKAADIRPTLCLNRLSPPVRAALDLPAGDKSAAIIRIAYVHALIEAQQPLTSEESKVFARALSDLLAADGER